MTDDRAFLAAQLRSSPAGLRMNAAADVACDLDRAWFAAHPKEMMRVRGPVPSEFELVVPAGHAPAYVYVYRLRDGGRARASVGVKFDDLTPIGPDVWFVAKDLARVRKAQRDGIARLKRNKAPRKVLAEFETARDSLLWMLLLETEQVQRNHPAVDWPYSTTEIACLMISGGSSPEDTYAALLCLAAGGEVTLSRVTSYSAGGNSNAGAE